MIESKNDPPIEDDAKRAEAQRLKALMERQWHLPLTSAFRRARWLDEHRPERGGWLLPEA